MNMMASSSKEYFRKKALEHYWRDPIGINEKRRNNPISLLSILKRNAIKRNLPFDLSKEQFKNWWLSQPKVCSYCDIPVERLAVSDRKKKLSKRLSIDRKDNSLGYTLDNITLACLKCNFIKSNLFSYEEMKEIGQKYLKPKWQKTESTLKQFSGIFVTQ